MEKKILMGLLVIGIVLMNFSFINGQIQTGNIQQTLDVGGTISVDSSEEKELWSEKQLCRFVGGCLEENFCYPFGYIRGEQYCGIYFISSYRRVGFINQSESGENCTYHFQCKSNFCFNNECVNSIESLTLGLKEKLEKENNLLEERIKSLEEQLNKTQIKENETNSLITGDVVSNFENEQNISFWDKLKNLFRRNK